MNPLHKCQKHTFLIKVKSKPLALTSLLQDFLFFFLQDFFIKQISDLLFTPFVLFIISSPTL